MFGASFERSACTAWYDERCRFWATKKWPPYLLAVSVQETENGCASEPKADALHLSLTAVAFSFNIS